MTKITSFNLSNAYFQAGLSYLTVHVNVRNIEARLGVCKLFEVEKYSGSKENNYQLLIKQLDALLEGEENTIANLSNAAALLNHFLNDINWVGFYLRDKDELVLGPFQGLPACVRIKSGRGVCGTAMSENKTMRISNVHQFPGHIACDAASRSEIVVPIRRNNHVYGVLDIDSPNFDRFDEVDQSFLEKFVTCLERHIFNE